MWSLRGHGEVTEPTPAPSVPAENGQREALQPTFRPGREMGENALPFFGHEGAVRVQPGVQIPHLLLLWCDLVDDFAQPQLPRP